MSFDSHSKKKRKKINRNLGKRANWKENRWRTRSIVSCKRPSLLFPAGNNDIKHYE